MISIFILLTFVKVYLVNLCLIFDDSFPFSSDSQERIDHLGWSVVNTATEQAPVSTNHTAQSIIFLFLRI